MKIKNTMLQADQIFLRNTGVLGEDFKLNPVYEKQILIDKENTYILKLFVSLINSKEHPFPVDFKISFISKFEFENVSDQQDILNYLNINAIQMIFPFIRSAIANIFGAALLPPLVLPVIDVRDFKEKL
jgi:preprotein translocase subunit SecB